MRRIGPIYDLEPGVRLQDIDAACRSCHKRLAEVIHDASRTWATGVLVCIDCGTTHKPEPRCDAVHPTRRCRCLYRPHDSSKQHVGRYHGGRVTYWDAA